MKITKFSTKGINTIEVIVVICAVAIVLAIAMPSFLRSKISGNESAAVSNLHKLAVAFETYRAINGVYPTDFNQLRSIIPPLVDEKFILSSTTGRKQGYDFTIDTDVVPTYAFRIRAVPTTAKVTGIRLFKIGSSSDEVNGVAYYAMGDSDPWKPIGYEQPGGIWDDDEEEQDCTGKLCSVCNGAGCITLGGPDDGDGSSCPYVYVYNGSQFLKDNDIIPGGNPHEYTDYYKLTKAVTSDKKGDTLLKIVEPLDEKSYLDKVQLLEVTHPKYVKIAPTPEGKIFTFIEKSLSLPMGATDSKGKDVLKLVSSKGRGNYHAVAGEFIVFNFGQVKITDTGLRLILSSDLEYAYAGEKGEGSGGVGPGQKSLHIQIFLDNKAWQEISIVHPHENWDIWAVDLAQFKNRIIGNLKIKIVWKHEHKLDFALLDSSKQVPLKIKELALLEARHSNKKDMLKLLTVSDNSYAFMKKDDEIALRFVGSKQDLEAKEIRDYIFASEGFYKSLSKK